MKKNSVYKLTFYNQGKVYEIYAKSICHDALCGFVEASELIFGETTNIVIDPSEECLKTEFAGVKTTFIPIHTILRIDAVEKTGVAKIKERDGKTSNVTQFPVTIYTPTPEHSK